MGTDVTTGVTPVLVSATKYTDGCLRGSSGGLFGFSGFLVFFFFWFARGVQRSSAWREGERPQDRRRIHRGRSAVARVGHRDYRGHLVAAGIDDGNEDEISRFFFSRRQMLLWTPCFDLFNLSWRPAESLFISPFPANIEVEHSGRTRFRTLPAPL